jgi:hypothetical protein
MAYSKAKLTSKGDKTSPCFKPFLTVNMSDKCLPTQTMLYLPIRHNVISLTGFMVIPNSIKILYKASRLKKGNLFYQQKQYWKDLPFLYNGELTFSLPVKQVILHN